VIDHLELFEKIKKMTYARDFNPSMSVALFKRRLVAIIEMKNIRCVSAPPNIVDNGHGSTVDTRITPQTKQKSGM